MLLSAARLTNFETHFRFAMEPETMSRPALSVRLSLCLLLLQSLTLSQVLVGRIPVPGTFSQSHDSGLETF